MPTSVLLAVLAAAGLLALAPALTRRYDATERVAAERATSTARVLSRRRRRRTVPGRRPVNPPSWALRRLAAASAADRRRAGAGSAVAGSAVPRSAAARSAAARSAAARSAAARSAVAAKVRSRAGTGAARTGTGRSRVGAGSAVGGGRSRRAQPARRPVPTALHRRRRVFLALVLLNVVELLGVLLVGPGFWIGFSVSFTVLLADLGYLRRRAVVATRWRRRDRRRQAWVAVQQAAVRREHARRAAERQAAARRAAAIREQARRVAARDTSDYVERYTTRPAVP